MPAALFLNQSAASQQLVSLFSGQHYSLVLNAPITIERNWTIAVGADAVYLRPYRFNNLQIFAESNRLSVLGIAPVLLENGSTKVEQVSIASTDTETLTILYFTKKVGVINL